MYTVCPSAAPYPRPAWSPFQYPHLDITEKLPVRLDANSSVYHDSPQNIARFFINIFVDGQGIVFMPTLFYIQCIIPAILWSDDAGKLANNVQRN